ncbi:MAG: hypothetical protein WCA20_06290 [Candidatus Sulfotelmatobacter sp.]
MGDLSGVANGYQIGGPVFSANTAVCCWVRERGVFSLLQQFLQGFEHYFPVFLGMLARLLGWIPILAQRNTGVISFR